MNPEAVDGMLIASMVACLVWLMTRDPPGQFGHFAIFAAAVVALIRISQTI